MFFLLIFDKFNRFRCYSGYLFYEMVTWFVGMLHML